MCRNNGGTRFERREGDYYKGRAKAGMPLMHPTEKTIEKFLIILYFNLLRKGIKYLSNSQKLFPKKIIVSYSIIR